MLQQKVFDFYHLLKADNLSLFYQGVTHDDITDKLISLSDENIRNQIELERIRKKVSIAISECFQNLIRHTDIPAGKEEHLKRPSMFMIRNIGRDYYIGSANLIKKEKARQLSQQLSSLKGLNADELRQMYLKILPDSTYTEKGGAGLGLIEMARKSKQRLEYDFLSLTRTLSLFFMQLSFCYKVQLEGIIEGVEEKEDFFSIRQVQRMYESLTEQNVMLLYKSDFSQDGMLPIIDMMENNLSGVAATRILQKKVMYVLVELFQNIVKHATNSFGRQEGVLLVAEEGEGYEISTGNFIQNSDIPFLEKHLNHLNSLDQEELKSFYRQELINTQKSHKGGAGLGLIETARYSRSRFSFGFLPIESNCSFFTLGIKI